MYLQEHLFSKQMIEENEAKKVLSLHQINLFVCRSKGMNVDVKSLNTYETG